MYRQTGLFIFQISAMGAKFGKGKKTSSLTVTAIIQVSEIESRAFSVCVVSAENNENQSIVHGARIRDANKPPVSIQNMEMISRFLC